MYQQGENDCDFEASFECIMQFTEALIDGSRQTLGSEPLWTSTAAICDLSHRLCCFTSSS